MMEVAVLPLHSWEAAGHYHPHSASANDVRDQLQRLMALWLFQQEDSPLFQTVGVCSSSSWKLSSSCQFCIAILLFLFYVIPTYQVVQYSNSPSMVSFLGCWQCPQHQAAR